MELTNNNIKQLKPGESLRDKRVTGLQLRAFEKRKSFYLYYRTKAGKERRPKLGDFPTIKLADARSIAQDILFQVAQGRDPQKERQTAKNAPTVAELCDLYITEHSVNKKSGWMDRMNFDNHIIPMLGKLKTHEVDIDDMERFPLCQDSCRAPNLGNINLKQGAARVKHGTLFARTKKIGIEKVITAS